MPEPLVLASHLIELHTDRRAEQVLHLPTPMVRDIETHAFRMGCTMSQCLERAWTIAGTDLGMDSCAEVSASRLLRGRKVPQRVELSFHSWHDVALVAERMDRSRSWLLQRAWVLARPRLHAA